MDIIKSIILGIIEGITEWLPISSTGHLIIADEFIKLGMTDEFMEMFNVVIQLGAILAVVVIFWNKMWPFTADKAKGYNYITKGNGLIKKDVMDMWFKVIAAMLPAAIVGIPFDNYFEKHFHNWQVVSAALIVYGVLFIVIEKINKGTANIFKIISNNEKFIVKEFQSKYSKENVLKEISAIEYLRKNSQVPLPIYLKNNNNELYFVHKGKMIVVQKFVEGQVFEKNKGNHEQILESARYLGLIIEGFKNYNIDDNISILDWYSNKEFEKANKKYDEILSKLDNSKISEKIKMDIIFKKELLAKLNKNINAEDIKNITHKVSHGDYSVLQFIYDNEDNIRVILDFIKTKKLPIVWEIARSYSYIDKDAKEGKINIENLVEYTKKVAEFTELNEYDLKYLPYVYLIQLARSTFGYSEYFKNIENKDEYLEFAFYRSNICRDLYKKADEISKKLLELKKE